MKDLVPFLLVGGCGLLVILGLAMTRRHRQCETNLEVVRVERRSVVHVLQNQEELQDALRRSAQFERRNVDMLRAPADRYEGPITPAPITNITAVRPSST